MGKYFALFSEPVKLVFSRTYRAIFGLCLITTLSFSVQTANGQILVNGTLDGPTGCCNAPPSWANCAGSPDRQIINGTGNGINGINVPPSNGTAYTGFISSLSGYREAIGQSVTLTSGVTYTGSVDLFRATSSTFTSWQGNGRMEIWGGSSCTNRNELLWASPSITNVYFWQTFPITFTPSQNHSYIIFWNTPLTSPGCYNCMDNIILGTSVLSNFETFVAENTEKGVELGWTTEPIFEHKSFQIAWSTDGLNYLTINQQDYLSGKDAYNYLHLAAKTGVNYYRLQAFDSNGELAMTENRSLLVDIEQITTIFPNPANGSTTIRFEHNRSEKIIVQVFAPTGQLVLETEATFAAGLNEMDLDLPENLSKGLYRLRMNIGERVEQHSLLIQK